MTGARMATPPGAGWTMLAVLAAGCASAGAPPPEGATGPTRSEGAAWVRVVDDAVAFDSAGNRYAHPFLGGLNVPRPQLVDIDGDGDLDVFVQEYSNRVMFFEQTGTPAAPHYAWRGNAFDDLEVGEWYRFVDMDRDGDPDLITEQPFSYIRYYRNDGTRANPAFVLAADTLKDADGAPIFSDRQNIPQATDIDCDGLQDLFIGRLTGTVMRYEETEPNAGAVPRFRLVTDRFEDIEIVAQIGSLHGANTMAFVDIDDDGDEDLFWGDFFEPGVLFIENTGSCERPSLRGEPVPFPVDNPLATSGYNAPTFGDLDGDGDRDLLVGVLGGAFNPNRTTIDNLHWLQRTGPSSFSSRTARFLPGLDVGSESFPAFADLDGDGDLDLYLGNKIDQVDLQTSVLYRYRHEPGDAGPALHADGTMPFRGAYHYAPAFADLDADGDTDILLGTWRANLSLYRNDGTPTAPRFVLADSAIVRLTRGSNATPALVDIDGDGDLDLFVGESSGTINFYRNVGSAGRPAYELVSDTFDDIDVGRRSVPTFTDLDGDGDQDMIVGTEADGLTVYRNDGTAQAPAFTLDSTALADLWMPPFATPTFADVDGDGDRDLFVGGIGGGVVHYERRGRR